MQRTRCSSLSGMHTTEHVWNAACFAGCVPYTSCLAKYERKAQHITAYEKRSFHIIEPEEQPANTRWNAAFFIHAWFACLRMVLLVYDFHASREAYVDICNGMHAVAHSGRMMGMHRNLQWNAHGSLRNARGTPAEARVSL